MVVRSITLGLCVLAVGCGGNSGSGSKSTTSATAATTSSTTTPVTTSTSPLPATFVAVGFETLDVGDQSPRGFDQGAHETHVATDADWASFWPTHSTAPLPAVDFTQQSVVGTFMGQMNSGTHSTRVVNVSRDTNSDDLHVVVREFRMGLWRPHPSVLTSPFHLVRCESAVSGQGSVSVDRQSLLDFESIGTGSNNALGVNDPAYTGGLEVFRDGASFSAFFAQIQPNGTPPVVDFQREMVVAVLGPYIARFGNSVQTLRLVHDPRSDEIRVISRVNPYRGGAAPPPAIEAPFQILRVTQATGPVRVEQSTPVTQTPLASGTSTLYTGPAEALIIRDAATFASLWTARVGGAAPQVDFAVDQVLIAFEPASARRTVSVARSSMLEDDELAVTVNTMLRFGAPTTGAPYSAVTTPRSFGPVTFETVDTTPAP